jgi:hypothetical protein
MKIDSGDRQRESAQSSIRESLESPSKQARDRRRQYRKQWIPIASSDEGRQIDGNWEHCSNAVFSIRESLEPDANVTVERSRHEEKQDRPMVSTAEGITIDANRPKKKAEASMRDR